MKRTTISLPDELAAALRREAHRRRQPVSRIAREALEVHLGLSGDAPRKLAFIGIASGDGSPVGRDAEEILAAEWARHIELDRDR